MLDLLVSGNDGKRSLWVVAAHPEWGNSFVAAIDVGTGQGSVRFVNTGILRVVHEMATSRGTYLLAGGFNNEHGLATVIDERTPYAVSPQTAGTRHRCLSCPPGDPDYYFVFPRSEISRIRTQYLEAVRAIVVENGQFQVSLFDYPASDASRHIYLFRAEPNIQPMTLRFSSTYDGCRAGLEPGG
jgi:hypothetical protein